MSLPKKEKREKRAELISLRVSRSVAHHLKELAKAHNMSQADVVEYLVKQEWELFMKSKTKDEGP